MAESVKDRMLAKWNELFDAMDKDGNGVVNMEEAAAAVQKFDADLNRE